METLTCATCSKDWKRPVVRGRKPRECPTCKDGAGTGTVASPKVTKRQKATSGVVPAQSSIAQSDDSGLYLITEDGLVVGTTRSKAYAKKRNAGASYCCAHDDHLGKLCEREQRENGLTCLCTCHTTA